ncbi:hypothetical protein E1B28_011022 [Marasmius oreades]|uniref:Uncharacterized protein n=1 Tax=Marasmius oreades TaxID=181124 RepID=A0A9P7RTB8_9AGAR|nr:uncharacterized protein E1B28_011022 [Marasmius oreades]KAG7089325.1 hypothetical protein E1B28_011022 [Marasmius oreades]
MSWIDDASYRPLYYASRPGAVDRPSTITLTAPPEHIEGWQSRADRYRESGDMVRAEAYQADIDRLGDPEQLPWGDFLLSFSQEKLDFIYWDTHFGRNYLYDFNVMPADLSPTAYYDWKSVGVQIFSVDPFGNKREMVCFRELALTAIAGQKLLVKFPVDNNVSGVYESRLIQLQSDEPVPIMAAY